MDKPNDIHINGRWDARVCADDCSVLVAFEASNGVGEIYLDIEQAERLVLWLQHAIAHREAQFGCR